MTTSAASPVVETLPERRRWFLSIRARLVLAFTLLFTVVFAGLGYSVYTFASQRALDRLAEDLLVLLRGAASGVNGDDFASMAQMEALPDLAYPEDERFWTIVDWLATVKRVDGRSGVYSIAQDPNNGPFFFVASASARAEPDDPGTARFRQPLELDPTDSSLDDFFALFDGRSDTWLLLDPYEDDFGYWISGYAAIKNPAGESVGVVGIDYQATYLYEVRRQILTAGIPIFITIYVVFIITIIILISRFMGPLKLITRAAESIGDGDYDTKLPARSRLLTSEMDILNEVFVAMVRKLDRRETDLRRQVEELKIEIDQAKASAQVSEIVDSDFFASLQSKAVNIRRRRAESESGQAPFAPGANAPEAP